MVQVVGPWAPPIVVPQVLLPQPLPSFDATQQKGLLPSMVVVVRTS